jgi:predicted Rdx family selenoprotein
MLRERGVEASATPGGKGQFDVISNGELVFSKHDVGRFPGEGEIERLVGGAPG